MRNASVARGGDFSGGPHPCRNGDRRSESLRGPSGHHLLPDPASGGRIPAGSRPPPRRVIRVTTESHPTWPVGVNIQGAGNPLPQDAGRGHPMVTEDDRGVLAQWGQGRNCHAAPLDVPPFESGLHRSDEVPSPSSPSWIL